MSDQKDILAANARFYSAFAESDLAAMEEIWAREAPVACIHPGWTAIAGRDAVLDSWRAIFDGPAAPRVRAFRPSAHLLGDVAFVTCYEAVGGGLLAATNLFVREGGVWLIAHHHAGPTAEAPPRDAPDGDGMIH